MNHCKLLKIEVEEFKCELSELKNKNGALGEHELMTGVTNFRSKADVSDSSEQ